MDFPSGCGNPGVARNRGNQSSRSPRRGQGSVWNPQALMRMQPTPQGRAGPPWTTGDDVLDLWVSASIHCNQLLGKLARISIQDRIHVVSICREKEGKLNDVQAYMGGCLKRITSCRGNAHGPEPWQSFPGGSSSDMASPALSQRRPSQGASQPSPRFGSAHETVGGPGTPQSAGSQPSGTPSSGAAPPSHSTSSGPQEMPPWSRDVAQAVGSKSNFLRLLYSKLSPSQTEWMQGASPELQYQLGVAMLFQCPFQESFQTAFVQVVASFSSIGSPGYTLAVARAAAPACLRVAVVGFGGRLAAPVVAVHAALKLAASAREAASVRMEPMWLFHDIDEEYKLDDRLLRSLSMQVVHGQGYLRGMNEMSRCAAHWTASAIHVLVVVTCPDDASTSSASCGPASASQTPDAGRGGVLQLMRWLQDFRSTHPSLRMSTFLTTASSGSEQLESQLDSVFGRRLVADPLKHNSPLPSFLVRSTCQLGEVRGTITPWSPRDAMNGMMWCGCESLDRVHRGEVPRLSASIMSVVDAQVFGPGDHSAADRAQLELVTARAVSGGEPRLQEVGFWLCFAGLQHFGFPEIVRKVLPCHVNISLATGTPASSSAVVGATVCGQVRWCSHCESVARAVLHTPHVGLLVEFLRAHLTAVIDDWLADPGGGPAPSSLGGVAGAPVSVISS